MYNNDIINDEGHQVLTKNFLIINHYPSPSYSHQTRYHFQNLDEKEKDTTDMKRF